MTYIFLRSKFSWGSLILRQTHRRVVYYQNPSRLLCGGARFLGGRGVGDVAKNSFVWFSKAYNCGKTYTLEN